MKDLRKSEDYQKAYRRADRICRFMPHLIDKMESPDGESIEQKQAFEDRISEYKIERDSMNNMPKSELMKKYGAKLIRYNQKRMKNRNKTKGE